MAKITFSDPRDPESWDVCGCTNEHLLVLALLVTATGQVPGTGADEGECRLTMHEWDKSMEVPSQLGVRHRS